MATTFFGRYELRGTLGHGGFATVYRAWDPALGREVALKALLPHLADNDDVRRRFVAEARALAGLHHPNIVTVFDVGEAEGRPFFAMELVQGRSLDRWLHDGPALSVEQIVAIVGAVAGALDALHAAGLVHRDVKPANVLLEPGGRVVLMDLGVARSLGQRQITQAGTSIGTPAYMAPEQVRGEPAGPAADVYALGVLTYHLLAGHPPFEGNTSAVLHAQVYTEPPPLAQMRPGLPPRMYAAITAALAKEPGARPATASAFAAAFAGDDMPTTSLERTLFLTQQLDVSPRRTAVEPPAATPAARAGRLPLLIGVLVALAVLVGGGAAIAIARKGGGSNNANNHGAFVPPVSVSPTATAPIVIATPTPAVSPSRTATPVVTTSATATPVVTATRPPVTATPPPTATRPPVTATAVVQPLNVSADDPNCCTLTVDRAELDAGNAVTLALSFVLHSPGWKSDNRPEYRAITFLTDEQGRRSDLTQVSGTSAADDDNATRVSGTYRFGALAAGTRWVWLHYGTDATTKRSLVVGLDLGLATPPGGGPSNVVASQRVGVNGTGAGGSLLGANDKIDVVQAENLGSGNVRLLLSFLISGTPGWDSDNVTANRTSIYLEDERGRRYNLVSVTGPAGANDATALTMSGFYRFEPMPAGVAQVRLHYGTTIVPFALGAAAPR